MRENTVDTLEMSRSLIGSGIEGDYPVAFLTEMSTSRAVEFDAQAQNHHFNLQLDGFIQVDWKRRRNEERHYLAPGHGSLIVAGDPFLFRVSPVANLIGLHVVIPTGWLSSINEKHREDYGLRNAPDFASTLCCWDLALRRPGYKIGAILQTQAAPSKLQLDELFIELGLQLCSMEGFKKRGVPKERLSPNVLAKVLDYLHAKYTEDISLADLAELSHLSMWHFARSFRATVGIAPWQYVREVRLVEARRLLLHSELNVTQIAVRTGFSTPSHFASAFRQSQGMSPNTFRNLHSRFAKY